MPITFFRSFLALLLGLLIGLGGVAPAAATTECHSQGGNRSNTTT